MEKGSITRGVDTFNLPNKPQKHGWFDRVNAIYYRGFALLFKLKVYVSGQRELLVCYGSQRRFVSNMEYQFAAVNLRFDWSYAAMASRPGHDPVDLSREDLALLFGFYQDRVDQDGELILRDGKPDIIYDVEGYLSYVKGCKKYADYSMLVFYKQDRLPILKDVIQKITF